MSRPKKNKEVTHSEEHNMLMQHTHEQIIKSCNDDELQINILLSINGFLMHIDKCLSIFADTYRKGGNANAKRASQTDDAREV